MPTLPTFNVTDEQAAKLMQAFGTAEDYRAWLREAIRAEVSRRRREALDRDHYATVDAVAQAAADEVLP